MAGFVEENEFDSEKERIRKAAEAERSRMRRKQERDEKEAVRLISEGDKEGIRYKSEVMSFEDLYKWFLGRAGDDADDDEDDKKKKKKTPVIPVKGKILGESRTFEQWLELRDRCRKDLFWLGSAVLKKDLLPHVHQIICDQFVSKNFDGAYHKDYTLGEVHKAIARQDREKDMMLMDPRGFYKSTIDGIDCVQWLLNVPDIRILILTGEKKLAKAFMSEIKGYFYLAEGAEPKDLHLLFPEYILTGLAGTSREPLQCPARNHIQKEASLWVNSTDSNLSGWHCDIRKIDDGVTDENSLTVDSRKSLKEKIDGTDNLVDEWGFTDFIGTRYFGGKDPDYYGSVLNAVSEDNPLRYFRRACWIVKPNFINVPLLELAEDMVVLNFPEKATFASLRKKLLKNERSFRNQQLNEPIDADELIDTVPHFPIDLLRKHTYLSHAAPQVGDIFVAFDWAPTAGRWSDYSCGVAGRIYRKDNGQWGICILDVIVDKWSNTELAFQIVAFIKKWNPVKTVIENSLGAELLKTFVAQTAVKMGVTTNIHWFPVDRSPDAKCNRIKGLETLLTSDRLYFVSGNYIDKLYDQFEHYDGSDKKSRGRKDDIPDAISFLIRFLPNGINGITDEAKAMMVAQEEIENRKAQQQLIFGSISIVRDPLPTLEPIKNPDPRNRYGIPGLKF
jgi:hypothetical protein